MMLGNWTEPKLSSEPPIVNTCGKIEDWLLPSVAFTLKIYVPAAVGVPERTPPEVRVKPGGKEPPSTVKVVEPEPPALVNAEEYEAPSLPEARGAELSTKPEILVWNA